VISIGGGDHDLGVRPVVVIVIRHFQFA